MHGRMNVKLAETCRSIL